MGEWRDLEYQMLRFGSLVFFPQRFKRSSTLRHVPGQKSVSRLGAQGWHAGGGTCAGDVVSSARRFSAEYRDYPAGGIRYLSLIHISEPTRLLSISYAV